MTSRENASVARLAAFLKASFPRDVLIPCPLGTKRPLFQYGLGQASRNGSRLN
jgi:hypothetical protein